MAQRIVQVVQHLAPGGIETLVLDLQRLAGPGTEFHIVSLEGTREELARRWPRAARLGALLHGLGKTPGVRPGLVASLALLFARLKPSAVQTHHIGPLLYAGIAARLAGVPRVVHTEHDAWHLLSQRRRKVQTFALGLVGPKVIAAGRAVARGLTNAIPSCRPTVIANAIDTARFRPGDQTAARERLGLPRLSPIVGAAGRLEVVKGHDVLLDAAFRLPPDVHVAIAGAGTQRSRLKALADTLGIADRVHFLGHVEDTVTFYQALDVYCLPSRNEGMPLSLLEAQSCGVPAVATRVGGVTEALCPDTSMLVPHEDSRGMAVALSAMLEVRLRRDPREYVLAHHDLDAMARAYRALVAA